MKKLLTLITALFSLCILSAQKPKPVQIQTVDTSKYVVEYVPLETAQKNVNAQLVQVNKQLEGVEKQMAELVKKRDDLMKQKAALEYLQLQLNQAANTPVQPPAPAPPQPTKSAEKPKKKGKN